MPMVVLFSISILLIVVGVGLLIVKSPIDASLALGLTMSIFGGVGIGFCCRRHFQGIEAFMEEIKRKDNTTHKGR